MDQASKMEIKKIVESMAIKKGFCNYKVDLCEGSKVADGFMGSIWQVTVAYKNKNNGNEKLHLIVKKAYDNERVRAELPQQLMFAREFFMYESVFPAFGKLEKQKGLAPSVFSPKLYCGQATNLKEHIVLEDLTETGFRLHDRRIPMDEDHVKLVITKMASLHAASFAMRDQNLKQFQDLLLLLKEDICKPFFGNRTLYCAFRARTKKTFDLIDDENNLKIYKKFVEGTYHLVNEVANAVDHHSVVLHGDCLTYNMMFRYDGTGASNKPSDVCFVDFQLSRVGPPTLDLACFFYASSSKEIIDHAQDYLQFYYSALSERLRELGSDPNIIFPYAVFQQQWKQFAKFGLYVALTAIHIMLTEKDEATNFKGALESGKDLSNVFNYKISNVEAYNERIKHLILHFIENGSI